MNINHLSKLRVDTPGPIWRPRFTTSSLGAGICLALLACDPPIAEPLECPPPEVIECEPPPPDVPSEADFQVCHQVDTGETDVFVPLGEDCPDGWAFVCEWPS